MNTIDQKQAAIFIAVFLMIALLINSTQGFQLATTTAVAMPSAVQQAEQAAAAQKIKNLARYLNGGFTRQAGSRSVAIVVADENGGLDTTITAALASRFKGGSVQLFTSAFTPEFVADGLFNEAVAGSKEVFRQLDLAGALDALVLAREGVQYSQNAALENVITATVKFDVYIVPINNRGGIQSWTFTANGPGFSKEVARKAAEDRLVKQITADTKMSLD